MKKYILCIVILCLLILFLVTACSKAGSRQNYRFKIVYKQHFPKSFRDIYILEDNITGIKYLYISNGGGITKLEEK
jgi:hypothetical protein